MTYKLYNYFRFLAGVCVVRDMVLSGLCSIVFPQDTAINIYCFIGGGNMSTRRKQPTCRKSLTNVNTCSCIEDTSPWDGRDSNFRGDRDWFSCKLNCHSITSTKAYTIRKEKRYMIYLALYIVSLSTERKFSSENTLFE